MKNKLLPKVLCALISLMLSVSASKAADRPNILLIVAGDQFSAGYAK